MTNFQKLKHEARRAEQRSDWARAIDLYRRALESDADMADLSLYNRIGDLHLRQGEPAEAVQYYEQAVDRYAAADMHTSAIALCNKILRIAPDRSSVYRRLAALHAKAGLLAEARGNSLTFARKALENGTPRDALEAVEAFVVETSDEEVRLQFAELLVEHEQPDLAAEQIAHVYRIRRSRGSDAQDLLDRLAAIGGEDAVGWAQAGAETEAKESPPTSGRPASDARLAELVSEALGDEAGRMGFEPIAPQSAKDAGQPDDGLQEVRQGYAEFREAVSGQVDGDPGVRYDLGVEMMTIGLFDEALAEFRGALVDPDLAEAATARIGECLALRHSVDASALPVASPAESTPEAEEGDETTAAPPSDVAGATGAEEDDDLQGPFFKARLAQYRIRRADERHTVDHAAHLDLGAAYVEMELLQEAVREYTVALRGPRKVARNAARGLVSLAVSKEAAPELSLHVLQTLGETDHPGAAKRLVELLVEAWGADHPFSERLAAVRDEADTGELPSLEAMFPPTESDDPECPDTVETVLAAEDLDEIDELLAQLEEVPDGETSTSEAGAGPDLAEARRLVNAGEADTAADLLTASLERLEGERRTRDALRVIAALLDIRRDDLMLHHRHTELALVANDRHTLLTAFSGLGACLRREGALTSARAAYGRMLDFDPENAEARDAIAAIDGEEVSGEAQARRLDDVEPAGSEPSEYDALLREIDTEGDEPAGEVVRPGESDEEDAETDSRLELGMAFKQMGMWEEAIRELEAALESAGDRLRALSMLAECFVLAERPADAVALLADELRADEDAAQVAALYWYGRALQDQGESQAARDVLARLEAVSPGYRDVAGRLSELSL